MEQTVTVNVGGEVESVTVGEQTLVGFAGSANVRYGFALGFDENNEDGPWGCDLFFRDPAYPETDALGYVWLEESRMACARADTPQAAVDYAMGTLEAMLRQLDDFGCLTIRGDNGHEMTIEA